MSEPPPPPPMRLALAVLPFVVMAGLFVAGMFFLPPGNTMIVTAMLGGAGVAGAIAVRRGVTWDALQDAAGKQLGELFPALILLLLIGGLVGGWMASGTIPYIVAIGLRLVDPHYFLLTAFLSTSLMSLVTGTSWGSVSTLGIALMGMAGVLDIDLAMAAGAVISGAYFGDKISPLSDTTIVCSLAVKADLYEHIRHLMWTSIPSWVAAGVLYWQLSALAQNGGGASLAATGRMLGDIERHFAWSPWIFAPPLVVFFGIARRWPAAIGLTLSIVVAIAVAVLVQGFSPGNAFSAPITGFRQAMLADPGDTGAAFAKLVERGGFYAMTEPFVIIVCAVLLTGAMRFPARWRRWWRRWCGWRATLLRSSPRRSRPGW